MRRHAAYFNLETSPRKFLPPLFSRNARPAALMLPASGMGAGRYAPWKTGVAKAWLCTDGNLSICRL